MDFVGFHHAMIGLFLMLIGFIVLISGRKTKTRKVIALIFISLGALIFADDVYQHYRQYTDPSYQSPLRVLYGKTLYRIPAVRWMNTVWDRIFGRKA